MHTNTVYAIYWVPSGYSVSTIYESLINRYFQDEAADSGKLTNVYSADTQYTDGTGSAAYSSTFGGSSSTLPPIRPRAASIRSGSASRPPSA